MKHLLFLSLLTLAQVSQAQLSKGLIAYWPLDGNGSDLSGHGHHGTFQWQSGKAPSQHGDSCAMAFLATPMDVPKSNEFLRDTFSISVWSYLEDWLGAGPAQLFAKKTTVQGDFLLTVMNDVNFMGNSYYISDSKVRHQHWNHFVCTYIDGLYEMYMNNVLVKSGMTSKVVFSDKDIMIGGSFYGRINDMRIYDRVITADEVGQLYRAPSSCAITTALAQDALMPAKPTLIEAVDLQGRIIPHLDSYKGLAILIYSDGSRRKICK